MDRRAFLQRFGIGVGAALALASLPAAAVDGLSVVEAGERCACEYLRRRLTAYTAGQPASAWPAWMRVSPGLFRAFEGELSVNERFTAPENLWIGFDTLLFKGVRLTADATLSRWEDLRFTEPAS